MVGIYKIDCRTNSFKINNDVQDTFDKSTRHPWAIDTKKEWVGVWSRLNAFYVIDMSTFIIVVCTSRTTYIKLRSKNVIQLIRFPTTLFSHRCNDFNYAFIMRGNDAIVKQILPHCPYRINRSLACCRDISVCFTK